jgi:ribosomal protein RSM22 (predicted rRNA methylase)
MRLTIPRSQGKQEFYDARKSTWGDIFPHEPKNAPQERYQSTRDKDKKTILKGQDIGKRRDSLKIEPRESYAALSKDLTKLRRTERVRATEGRSSSNVLS